MIKPKTGPYRLTQGGQIDRTRTIPFRFNNETYTGNAGDTLASALLANGVRTVSRSFKFHRPRGMFSCGMEEPNGLLQVGTGPRATPSARAPFVELTPNLEAFSQSGWPGVAFDVGRALDFTAPMWAAGFYNKTFIWPNWHTYEAAIRRMAGLGKAPTEPDPDRYEVRNLHCDVLVIGAGVTGLKAALEAAHAGARVVLVEQDRLLGGQALWDGSVVESSPATDWIGARTHELDELPGVTLLRRTTAVGCYDHNVLALSERNHPPRAGMPRERYWIARAGRVVLATGAIEQPLIFGHNDRPGIMLAGAIRQYLLRYGVAPGRRVLLAANNESVYGLAKELKEAGVKVLGVVDSRHDVPEATRAAMQSLSIEISLGSIPVDTAGFSALRSVTVGRLSNDGRRINSTQTLECDALAVSGGWSPNLHLFAQAGGKLAYDPVSGSLQPTAPHPSIEIEIAGSAALAIPIGPRVSPVGNTRRQWVDLLHDVTVADLELALRENYTSVEHVKRYTTVGMAADQGKTSAAATLGILARIRGIPAAELGHTTLRPPFTPVTLGAIAGRDIGERYAPSRLLPIHAWHARHGALVRDFAGWQRPVAYMESGESREMATLREARSVRAACGLFDASPLGKIEVQGPDALEFLDRFYINDLKTLQPGRVRYGLMLRETGAIFDDGTVVMLAPGHFLITTTSGNAERVYAWLEEWRQCEWPRLRVAITAVTEQWATISLAGPRARAILSKLDSSIDLTRSEFPHLTMRTGRLLNLPTRIYRVSFTGELTYEINVPAAAGPRLWEALLEAGAPEELKPLGLDALLQLRLEKGFLHVGTETDATTVPADVGWGKVAAQKASDFVGKRSLALPENLRSDRLQLVGLTMEPGRIFVVGSHLRLADSRDPSDGWITSAGTMASTGDPIALAMLRAGHQQIGTEVTVQDGDAVTHARVVSPPFFDKSGGRMHA